jgi:molecular chaperone DnaJ
MGVRVTLLEAAEGAARNLEIPRWDNCVTCGGSGAKPGTSPKTCDQCGGQGQVETVQRTPFGQFVSVNACPRCQGKGKVIQERCAECHGQGQVRQNHKLEVKVPAGVETGTRLRIVGEGENGSHGGSRGDLFLVIEVERHKDFEREGGDLHGKLFLNYPQAVLGASLEIQTLIDGSEKIDVSPGTPHGRVLKIKGKGMPRLRGQRGRGDLYLHVFIDVPTKLTEKQKSLVTELAKEMKTPVGAGEEGILGKFKKFFD